MRGKEEALAACRLILHPLGVPRWLSGVSRERGSDGTAYLNPFRYNHRTGETDYSTYTTEELVEEFPDFAEAVGVYGVRDIDRSDSSVSATA